MKDSPSLSLAADTLLVRADGLVVRLDDAEHLAIELDGELVVAPPLALDVLALFRLPRSVGEAIAALARAGQEDFIETSTVLLQLARAGILRSPHERVARALRGYVRPSIHIAMLEDRVRTDGFLKAVRDLVRPSDVVVDIGTGTGVLAAGAAQAGARRVFAVESSGIADVAERLFADNGLAEKVHLVRERSTRATLPERATLLVTEMIGNDPLDEQLLEVVADAKARLLAPGARLIPSAIRVFAIVVDLPEDFIARHAFTAARLAAYASAYAIDFAALAGHRLGPAQRIMVKTSEARAFGAVATPLCLADVDLTGPFETSLHEQTRVVLDAPARHLGLMLAFEATLAPGVVLSTLPDVVDPRNHWRYALFLAGDDAPWSAGDTLEVDYLYERGTTTLKLTRG